MKVELSQTHQDYYNAYQYISARLGKSTRWRYLAIGVGVFFGALFIIGSMSIWEHYEKYSYLQNAELTFGITLIVLAFIILFVGLKIYNLKVRPLIFEKDGLFLSKLSFHIESDYLVHFMSDNRYEYRWKNMQEVEKTESYIFIFLDRGVALYIPRHGFKSDQEYEVFYNELAKHL